MGSAYESYWWYVHMLSYYANYIAAFKSDVSDF